MDDQLNLHFLLNAHRQEASTQAHISTSVTYADPWRHTRGPPGAARMRVHVGSTKHGVSVSTT